MSTPIASSTTAGTVPSSVVSSQGIGSGLDIASIVTQLTTSKAAPETNALNRSKTALTAQVSAFGTFSSALSTFQATLAALKNPATLAGRTATLADTTIASATATGDAVPAQYSIQVQNLATSASLSSPPQPSAGSTVGTGTLNITVGGSSSSISIDSTNNTLQGIAAAINSASDNPGISATVISTTDGARLVLSGTATGAANAITVTQSGGDGGLASLVYDPAHPTTSKLTQTQAAQNANFSINGFPATSAGNQVDSAITGVTLNLLKPTASSTPTTLTVGNDAAGAQTSVGTFVTALNGLLTSVQTLTSYDPATGTAGTLLGNQTMLSFQNQLSHILGQVNAGIGNGPNSLAALGITANPQGTYSSNANTLSNTLTANLSSVTKLLSGPTGIATQIDTFVSQYTQAGGLLDGISNSLKARLNDNTKQQAALTARMSVYAATLTQQYNAMDTAVALLKQTQTYLTQAFNQGSGSNFGSTSSNSSLGSGTLSTGG